MTEYSAPEDIIARFFGAKIGITAARDPISFPGMSNNSIRTLHLKK
jgi:hypothetical protein